MIETTYQQVKTTPRLKLQMENDPNYDHGKLLKLNGKIVYDIPNELATLNELTTLDLSAERESGLMLSVRRLPSLIFSLTNLKCLHLDVNNISYLPNEIGYLKNLERFTCTNNKLQTLPISFINLKKLKSLHLGSNLFKQIPKQIFSLLDLVFLDFSNNYISFLPEELGNLSNLETLILIHNYIQELPQSIGKLKNLRTLWLAFNDLTELPKSFTQLTNLEWSHLQLSSHIDNNPLEKPPVHICVKGTRAIKKYFDDLVKKTSRLTAINETTRQEIIIDKNNNIIQKPVYLPSIKLNKSKFK